MKRCWGLYCTHTQRLTYYKKSLIEKLNPFCCSSMGTLFFFFRSITKRLSHNAELQAKGKQSTRARRARIWTDFFFFFLPELKANMSASNKSIFFIKQWQEIQAIYLAQSSLLPQRQRASIHCDLGRVGAITGSVLTDLVSFTDIA